MLPHFRLLSFQATFEVALILVTVPLLEWLIRLHGITFYKSWHYYRVWALLSHFQNAWWAQQLQLWLRKYSKFFKKVNIDVRNWKIRWRRWKECCHSRRNARSTIESTFIGGRMFRGVKNLELFLILSGDGGDAKHVKQKITAQIEPSEHICCKKCRFCILWRNELCREFQGRWKTLVVWNCQIRKYFKSGCIPLT